MVKAVKATILDILPNQTDMTISTLREDQYPQLSIGGLAERITAPSHVTLVEALLFPTIPICCTICAR
jgi:ATP-dependent 26S proteasome regulatory subunit